MNKPHLIVSRLISERPIMLTLISKLNLGEPEEHDQPYLLAYPIEGLDIPPGPYTAYIQLGITHDELELKAEQNHPTLKFGKSVYGPVVISEHFTESLSE